MLAIGGVKGRGDVAVDFDVDGVEQVGAFAAVRREEIDIAFGIEIAMPGGFDEAAVAGLLRLRP